MSTVIRNALLVLLMGCAVGGCAAAAGAGVAGGAYEIQNRRALEELDRQLESGEITREEYLRRKKEIEERSVVY